MKDYICPFCKNKLSFIGGLNPYYCCDRICCESWLQLFITNNKIVCYNSCINKKEKNFKWYIHSENGAYEKEKAFTIINNNEKNYLFTICFIVFVCWIFSISNTRYRRI
jgi:hypothetical protein